MNDIIYNQEYALILPYTSINYLDGIKYSFKNAKILILEEYNNNYDEILNYLNRNNYEKLILVDFTTVYENLENQLNKECEFLYLSTTFLGNLTNKTNLFIFEKVFELFKEHENAKLGLIDNGLYEALNNKYKNIFKIKLDIEKTNHEKSNNFDEIGILGNDYNVIDNVYNALSAIKLSGKTAKVYNPTKTTKDFLKLFNIKNSKVKHYEDLFINNYANIYANFTNISNIVVLKSMDNEIPIILGNTNIFDKYKTLKENLVLKSDDDINEISNKIKNIDRKHKEIFKEYKKFRENYSKESLESIKKFLNYKEKVFEDKKYDKLLSVIVPVYNTGKYLDNCLKSIIDAKIDNMEIIIINDGSKDNSLDIIMNYKNKYNDLIKVINQENKGIGKTRNVGLKNASGKYITFVDSDDEINKNTYKDSLKYINDDIDIVIFNWKTIMKDGIYETSAIEGCYQNINKYKALLYSTLAASPCNKITKREIYDKLNITFYEDIYEDLSLMPFLIAASSTIKYIEKPYYSYFIRNNSIMRSKPGNSMIDVLNDMNKRIDKYKEFINTSTFEFKFNTFAWRIEEYIINPMYSLEEDELKDAIDYFYDNFLNTFIEITESNNYIQMLNNIDNKQKKEEILRRNKLIKENKLYNYIQNNKENTDVKLTPVEIVYGKQ